MYRKTNGSNWKCNNRFGARCWKVNFTTRPSKKHYATKNITCYDHTGSHKIEFSIPNVLWFGIWSGHSPHSKENVFLSGKNQRKFQITTIHESKKKKLKIKYFSEANEKKIFALLLERFFACNLSPPSYLLIKKIFWYSADRNFCYGRYLF